MNSHVERGAAALFAVSILGAAHGDTAIEQNRMNLHSEPVSGVVTDSTLPELLHCPAMLPQQKIGQTARQCADFDENLDVAIVDFTSDSEQIEKVAQNVETYVLSMPDNPFNITVDVIPASRSSQKALKHQKQDCLVGDDQSQMASVVAARLMPELVSYERIIANTDRESCDQDFDGLAFFGEPRYTEVLAVESEQPEAATVGNQSESDRRTFTSLHELYHTLGLGHSGYWTGKDGMLDQYLDARHFDDATVSINLPKYLSAGMYQEYGQGFDVMGSRSPVSPLNQTGFNVMQQERLHWAQIELGDRISVEHDLTNGPVTFTSHPNEFATYTFSQPLHLPPSGYKNNTQFVMNSLAMVPVGVNDLKGNEGLGVEVYAFNSQGPLTLVNLGSVYDLNQELSSRSVALINGKEEITITTKDKAVTLSVARH